MSINSLAGFKAMCGCFTGLTVIAVGLRFVARKKNELPLKADDWFMLAALVLFLGNMTTVFLLARVNFSGYNGNEGTNKVNIFVEQVTTAYQLLITWTLGAAKASVLFFYMRVFCQHKDMNSGFRIAIIATLVINACWVIAFFFLGLFQCGNHFSFGGNHFQYCTLINQYQEGFYVSDIVLDVWIMAMPIPYILRLNMNHWKKWLSVIVFLLSFVGIGASIARLVNYLQTPHLSPGHHTGGQHTRTRSAWTTYIWFGTLEMGTAIVAINLPTLYGLFARHAPEMLLRASRSWSSIASRALGTSSDGGNSANRSDVWGYHHQQQHHDEHEQQQQQQQQQQQTTKVEPGYNSTEIFAGVPTTNTSRTHSTETDDIPVDEICVYHQAVQQISSACEEKPHQVV